MTKVFRQGASLEEIRNYNKSCRWQVQIAEHTGGPIVAPDGRRYTGHHVGSLRAKHGETMTVRAPSGEDQTVDLRSYRDDQHIDIRFINLDKPTPDQIK